MPLTLERKNFIAEVRQRAGCTQAELARRTGLSQSSISQIEQPVRQPRLDTLRRIAKALGCDVSSLIDGAAL
jgi:transcriptional regulator with XRE-family HTH domain